MAASNAKLAHGTLLKKGGTTIAEVISISGPGIDREFVDITHMESPDAVREFLPTLVNSGELTCEVNFLSGTHNSGLIDVYSNTKTSWSIVWSDGGTWSWQGYAKGIEPSAEVAAQLKATITLMVTGKVTF